MNQTLITVITLLSFLNNIIAQQSCEDKITIACRYLETKTIDANLYQELEASLVNCLSTDATSLYIEGLLAFNKKPNPDYNLAYQKFNNAATLGSTKAKTYLGYAHYYGWDNTINFTEALFWLQQAAQEEDSNALYTLGYFYLKGFAGLEIDYEVAVTYFEQSHNPMAKFWLGVCTYLGWGTIKDEMLALQLLENSNTYYAQTFLNLINTGVSNFNQELLNYNTLQNKLPFYNILDIENTPLYGTLFEKDWSNQKIIRTYPVEILFTTNNNDIFITIKVNNQIIVKPTNLQDNLINLGDLQLQFSNFFEESNPHNILTYSLQNAHMFQDPTTLEYEIDCNFWVNEFQEPAPPISIKLWGIDQINHRIDNTLGAYPNYFQQQFTVGFTLERESEVSAILYDMNGVVVQEHPTANRLQGNHAILFQGNTLMPGNYFMQLTVDNYTFTRQVVKVN